uniref:NAC transcription factor 39 n=1 Tax=Litchi chinensis TaxID=151069 RepID=A0A8K1HZP5_LITCN|nr:NAC transcription factor 39 [Litchi chinensis]
MCPPASFPPPDLSFACTHDELFNSFEGMMSGFPLPTNVVNDVNPYIYVPSNLPDGVWYFVRSNENTDVQHGYWRAKGEACEVYSNSVIIGWRTTLEFYEGQAPDERKTNWVMQEFRITHKRDCKSRKSEDSSSLCRVFLNAEQNSNSEKQQNMTSAYTTTEATVQSALLELVKDIDDARQDSASKSLVKDDKKATELAISVRPEIDHMAYQADIDIFARGDYLELDDLNEPISRSSVSDSSCMTLSSDEYFDSDALLKDLESQNNKDKVQCDAGHKYIVSAYQRPNDVVVFPASFASVERHNSPTQEIHKTDSSMPGSAIGKGLVDHKALKQANAGQNADHGDEGTQIKPHAHVASSSNSHSAVRNREKKKGGSVKKLKLYLCFLL